MLLVDLMLQQEPRGGHRPATGGPPVSRLISLVGTGALPMGTAGPIATAVPIETPVARTAERKLS